MILTVTGRPEHEPYYQAYNVYYAMDAGGNGYVLHTTEILVKGCQYEIQGDNRGYVITVTNVRPLPLI